MHTTTTFVAPFTVLWSGLSLHPSFKKRGCLPLSLYTLFTTFKGRESWLGITTPMASPSLIGDRMQVSSHAAHFKMIFLAYVICLFNLVSICIILRLSPTSYQTAPPRDICRCVPCPLIKCQHMLQPAAYKCYDSLHNYDLSSQY